VIYENIRKEIPKMIVMDIKVDNFFAFRNFHINTSYPKKIVDSYIEQEFLEGRSNFRYKKVNVLMGANATGKTSIGKMIMHIFNFMDHKNFENLVKLICDNTSQAFFSIDFVVEQYCLYRVITKISPMTQGKYTSSDIDVLVKCTNIGTRDSYETCSSRLDILPENKEDNYMEELNKVHGLSWMFQYPMGSFAKNSIYKPENPLLYTQILNYTLQALDPSVERVEAVGSVENTYVIKIKDHSVVMQDGKFTTPELLSSGTKAGVEVADMISSIFSGEHDFYYCDEKFSYIHSDIEKAFLTIMIQRLKNNSQLFFTTHNTDILDMPLPKHSFSFLKRDIHDSAQPIKCICASEYLKRNTDSLRSAADNDLFSASPSLDFIYKIAEL